MVENFSVGGGFKLCSDIAGIICAIIAFSRIMCLLSVFPRYLKK